MVVVVLDEEMKRRRGTVVTAFYAPISGIDAGVHLWPPRDTDPLRTTACQDFVKSGWIHDF